MNQILLAGKLRPIHLSAVKIIDNEGLDVSNIINIKVILYGRRLNLPTVLNVLKKAEKKTEENQNELEF